MCAICYKKNKVSGCSGHGYGEFIKAISKKKKAKK